MERHLRAGVLKSRRTAMEQLSALSVEEIPKGLPEIQQLRLQISQARALILAMEMALQSLYERELPRSQRTVDENAFLVHLESRELVSKALGIIAHMKDTLE